MCIDIEQYLRIRAALNALQIGRIAELQLASFDLVLIKRAVLFVIF
jgi:hypothetical protein